MLKIKNMRGETLKDYIIWLKSGECITGTVKENIINDLQDRFKDSIGETEKISFNDEDGKVVVDLSRVEAIGINKCYENKEVGFKS